MTPAENKQDSMDQKQTARRVQEALRSAGLLPGPQGKPAAITGNAEVVLQKRYLSKDKEGNILEDTAGMFQRVAHNLSKAELNYGATEEQRKEIEERFRQSMTGLDLLPNSPTLMNAGRELQQLSACFVLPVGDSLEDIFTGVKETALIHKSGGGTGFSFSRLRPEGDAVGSTGGVASGPVSFIRAYDTATDVVKQGGTRRGANMGILDVSHPDILKFIESKKDGVSLQNFNISVAATDEFMRRVEAGEEYDLINPRTGETTGRLNAKDVFDLIVQNAWETGDPGLVFIDAINRGNPNPALGRIESTNPCVTADTVIETTTGAKPVSELTGKKFTALADGKPYPSGPDGFFRTGHRETVRITTTSGRSVTLTPEHRVLRVYAQPGGSDTSAWIQAGHLKPGNRVRIHNHASVQETLAEVAQSTTQGRTAAAAPATMERKAARQRTYAAERIAEITLAGTADVYDVRIPGINAFDGNGFWLHNCGEQPMLPYESCNLASVNLANMILDTEHGPHLDIKMLRHTVTTAVRMLDNVIDMNRYPIPEIENMTKRTRRIGLGVMGLADMLIRLGVGYDTKEGLEATGTVMSLVQNYAHKASGELAKERGNFPAWEQSIYGNESGTDKMMRNSAPVTIAPTGTISIIAGVSSGIEPLYALAYSRNVMDRTILTEMNPVFAAVARHEGLDSPEFMEHVARTGSLEGTDAPGWMKRIFRVSHDIAPDWHVAMQATVQQHTDNAVSKTTNFPQDATTGDVARAYLEAFRSGCKGITVYRDGSKQDQVLSTAAPPETQHEDGEHRAGPRSRPQTIHGITDRVRTGHGNMYVTINFDEHEQPFEVFGNLGKAGGCDSAQLEAISRLVSLALRSGVDPGEIVEQISGITCCPAWDGGVQVKSSPDALALALARNATANGNRNPTEEPDARNTADATAALARRGRPATGAKCPDCNSQVHFGEGCLTCPACGWSRCE